jgi:hypothetical protein
MVFFGATLPAKNMAIRMNNLNIALKNDQIKLLNAVNIISQNVNNPPEIIQAKIEKLVGEPTNMRDYNTPLLTPRNVITPSIVNNKKLINLAELQAKLNSPNKGLKTPATVNLEIDEDVQGAESASRLSKAPPPVEVLPPVSVAPSDISNTSAENQEIFNNIKNDINFDLEKIDNEDNFNGFISKWLKRGLPLTDRFTAKPPGIMLPYRANKPQTAIKFHELKPGNAIPPAFKNAWPLFQENKKEYINKVNQELVKSFMSHGAGLFKTKSSLASKRAPNFGNLWLNEKSLKKNVLSIMRPYSNIYEITAKSISSLLKKMIIDIANTLEFDIKDYENLESSEKKIIERIINKQKQMKNYNIQTLIGDDINKSRKRLEILFGQINSGNDSSLVFAEAFDLLKSLFENGAISHTKMSLLKRNLRAHMED